MFQPRSLPHAGSLITFAAIAAAATIMVSCGASGGITDATDGQVDLRAVTAAPGEGTLAAFVYPGAMLAEASYPGEFAGQAATFYRIDDSTVALIVPAIGPRSADVTVQFGAVIGRATVAIAAGVAIIDPDAKVIAPLDAFVAGDLSQPMPDGYVAGWTTDSTATAKWVADAKAAWPSLSASDRTEIARLVAAAATPPAGATLATAAAAECQALVTSFTAAFDEASALFDSWSSALGLKKVVIGAVAVVKYTAAVIRAGLVSQRCTTWKNFQLTSTPAASPGSAFNDMSIITVVGGRWRTTIPRDPSTNLVSRLLSNARKKLERISTFLGFSYPFTNGVEVQEGETTVIDPDRVSLVTTSTTVGTTALSLGYEIFQAGDQLLPAVKVLSTLKASAAPTLKFKVQNEEWGAPFESEIEAPVSLPPVCYEGAKKFRGCVDKVEVTPGKSPITVGMTSSFTAKTWDQFGTEVVRDLVWSAVGSDATVNAGTGIVTGAHAAKTATIRATAASGVSNTATLEIYAPVTLTVSGVTMTGHDVQVPLTINGTVVQGGKKECSFAWSGIATGGGKGTVLEMQWLQESQKGANSGTITYNTEFSEGVQTDDNVWWWQWSENGIPVYVPFQVTVTYKYRDNTSGVEKMTPPAILTCH